MRLYRVHVRVVASFLLNRFWQVFSNSSGTLLRPIKIQHVAYAASRRRRGFPAPFRGRRLLPGCFVRPSTDKTDDALNLICNSKLAV
jgi:hypothetical protein